MSRARYLQMPSLACAAALARLGVRSACLVLSAFVTWQEAACLVADGWPRVLKYNSGIESIGHVNTLGQMIATEMKNEWCSCRDAWR